MNKKIKSFFFFTYITAIFYLNNKYSKKNKKLINIKVCLCTLGKLENKYIREFVEHYKNYGVDKIFLYDNNDIDGERFEEVINDYIKNEFVEVENWRGIPRALIIMINKCYQNNKNKYDWLIFYELDEFIFLKNYNNIKTFLSQEKFNNCKSIQLNWVHRSDNNLMYYDERPLAKRFKKKGKNVNKQKINKLAFLKQ